MIGLDMQTYLGHTATLEAKVISLDELKGLHTHVKPTRDFIYFG